MFPDFVRLMRTFSCEFALPLTHSLVPQLRGLARLVKSMNGFSRMTWWLILSSKYWNWIDATFYHTLCHPDSTSCGYLDSTNITAANVFNLLSFLGPEMALYSSLPAYLTKVVTNPFREGLSLPLWPSIPPGNANTRHVNFSRKNATQTSRFSGAPAYKHTQLHSSTHRWDRFGQYVLQLQTDASSLDRSWQLTGASTM